MILTYIGDALWVLVLATMFGAARQAWGRTRPGEPVRLPIGEIGRGLGVWALPFAAFAFSLWLALRARDAEGEAALIVFGVRATTAPLLALLQLWLLKGVLRP
ncbi:MAG: hypothetical protein E7812_18570 [Phenylobacterium sp.]|nr:MAG: hypothetical protein E7812_18570 [Phenylobacterium sp.]